VLGKLPEEKLPEFEEKFRAIEKFVSDWLAEGYDRAASRFKA